MTKANSKSDMPQSSSNKGSGGNPSRGKEVVTSDGNGENRLGRHIQIELAGSNQTMKFISSDALKEKAVMQHKQVKDSGGKRKSKNQPYNVGSGDSVF